MAAASVSQPMLGSQHSDPPKLIIVMTIAMSLRGAPKTIMTAVSVGARAQSDFDEIHIHSAHSRQWQHIFCWGAGLTLVIPMAF